MNPKNKKSSTFFPDNWSKEKIKNEEVKFVFPNNTN